MKDGAKWRVNGLIDKAEDAVNFIIDCIKNLAKLIDVKSILTLILTVVFAVLSLKSRISPEQFQTVFTVVISFYFGTQYQKNRPD